MGHNALRVQNPLLLSSLPLCSLLSRLLSRRCRRRRRRRRNHPLARRRHLCRRRAVEPVASSVRTTTRYGKHTGILLLVYMESTREVRRACTMQMIPRYGLFIVSHLRVYAVGTSRGRVRAICYYIAYRKVCCGVTHALLDDRSSRSFAPANTTSGAHFCLRYTDVCDTSVQV